MLTGPQQVTTQQATSQLATTQQQPRNDSKKRRRVDDTEPSAIEQLKKRRANGGGLPAALSATSRRVTVIAGPKRRPVVPSEGAAAVPIMGASSSQQQGPGAQQASASALMTGLPASTSALQATQEILQEATPNALARLDSTLEDVSTNAFAPDEIFQNGVEIMSKVNDQKTEEENLENAEVNKSAGNDATGELGIPLESAVVTGHFQQDGIKGGKEESSVGGIVEGAVDAQRNR
ncbi:hypothetical protein CLAFUW4_07563 [Fulvia fulva]|uniref:Uncharacterized protein n=1 Tax=Passalora fulva TaxID=5499 RepID=A0A9Q8PAK9_PASFU|nr:uncharacterized protein CLAFUR5_07693 [Fulvia fulva]KAK4621606.1 hypothetical protein CLAFUR4_07569 [Fulvia fulva]KAK4623430.1 hypothetical protein CLAFUR0_07568 [Fulvia fulva]UJO18959.1 hypothetical protein CLAFUR5_07693 [Fulvia fulva]WPV16361.1 hypothetical protein CLAFUW4_07563 [Fulvia fulva]WPV31701.1 hypothetical protein CLAFUW7_07565 [Fulvia fulva]